MTSTPATTLHRLAIKPSHRPSPERRTFEVSPAAYLELCKNSDWLIERVTVSNGRYRVEAERVAGMDREAIRQPMADA